MTVSSASPTCDKNIYVFSLFAVNKGVLHSVFIPWAVNKGNSFPHN